MKVNLRKGGKYREAREWAYDLIANSTNTAASEMAEMMAEQFGFAKGPMGHTLYQMVENGALKATGYTIRNGKRTAVLVAARRRTASAALPLSAPPPPLVAPIPNNPSELPTTNGTGIGVYVVLETEGGPIKLTVEQAKALSGVLGMFK